MSFFLVSRMGLTEGKRRDKTFSYTPFEVIRPWKFALPRWTKGTEKARICVDEAVPNQFVLPLEALATFATWTTENAAIMRSVGYVNV
jgi:hypothetical protein